MANGSPEGVASSDGSEYVLGQVSGLGFGTIVFTGDHVGRWSPLETHLQKTTTHELGHLLGAGRADDENQFVVFPDEVYSGSDRDETDEDVGYTGPNQYEWSVMSSGWNSPINNPPMSGNYVAFSVEELSTVTFKNIDTKGE